MEMTPHMAIGIVEGFATNPGKSPEEKKEIEIKAWQLLIDSELCWQLQGWFGRTAAHLIEIGVCQPKIKEGDA